LPDVSLNNSFEKTTLFNRRSSRTDKITTRTVNSYSNTRIEATDRQIDTRVYELYELTEEEIRIVEGM